MVHGLAGDTCARAAATAAPIADDVAASLKSAHGRPDPLFEMTTTATPPVTCYIIRMYIGYLVHSRYSITILGIDSLCLACAINP